MPAIDFPNSPTNGQVFTAANKSWTYDGTKWIITQYNNAMDQDVTDYIDQEIADVTTYVDQQVLTAKGLAVVFGFLS